MLQAVVHVKDQNHVWHRIIGHLGKLVSLMMNIIVVIHYTCCSSFHRISLLVISVGCAISTFLLACYLFKHRKCKVFKVASPIFLLITLIGCAMMYMEVSLLSLFDRIKIFVFN